jgi:hypothetical protein
VLAHDRHFQALSTGYMACKGALVQALNIVRVRVSEATAIKVLQEFPGLLL